MTYNVSIPYPFLWSDPRPFFGPFDRRRRPRTLAAVAVEEESFRFEPTWRDDGRPALERRWVMVVDVNGGFSLRAEWNHSNSSFQ